MAKQFQKSVLSVVNDTTTNSAAIDCSDVLQISVQAVSTGTPTATVKIQASNDTPIGKPGQNGVPWVPTNWTDVPSATVSLSAAGSKLIPKTDLCYQFIRIVFTSSSGDTGTTAVNIKTIGA